MKTYNFGGYFVTTDQIVEGYISVFDVTTEEAILIDNGANITVENDILIIEE